MNTGEGKIQDSMTKNKTTGEVEKWIEEEAEKRFPYQPKDVAAKHDRNYTLNDLNISRQEAFEEGAKFALQLSAEREREIVESVAKWIDSNEIMWDSRNERWYNRKTGSYWPAERLYEVFKRFGNQFNQVK